MLKTSENIRNGTYQINCDCNGCGGEPDFNNGFKFPCQRCGGAGDVETQMLRDKEVCVCGHSRLVHKYYGFDCEKCSCEIFDFDFYYS
jgi:hypothetical protein